jgi:hypothetical protein
MKILLTLIFGFTIVFGYSQNIATSDKMNNKDDSLKLKKVLFVDLKVLDDSMINITVTNSSTNLIKAYSYVKTYEKHYDYFEIEAVTPDNDKMYFCFYDNRDKSAPVIVELKPGESFSHTINFLQWAERSVNKNTLKLARLNHLPHGIKIRAKYRNSACDNCNDYYKSIWTGFVYSDWVDF